MKPRMHERLNCSLVSERFILEKTGSESKYERKKWLVILVNRGELLVSKLVRIASDALHLNDVSRKIHCDIRFHKRKR